MRRTRGVVPERMEMATDRTGLYVMVFLCMMASCDNTNKLRRIESKLETTPSVDIPQNKDEVFADEKKKGLPDILGLKPVE